MATVRYLVNDVEESISFYTDLLGFEVKKNFAPAMAILEKGDLVLWVAGPVASAAQSMPDGSRPAPGGWNRFVVVVEDIVATVAALTEAGAKFRNEIVSNQGRQQILLEDPSGNVVEIFQWGVAIGGSGGFRFAAPFAVLKHFCRMDFATYLGRAKMVARRYSRFSLRTLMIVATLVAICCAFSVKTVKRLQKNKTVVAMVLESGGGFIPGEPNGPKWLHKYLAQEYFFNFSSVSFNSPAFNDKMLAKQIPYLNYFSAFNTLNLMGTGITDSAIPHLAKLKRLQYLYIQRTGVTAAGIAELKALLPNCEISTTAKSPSKAGEY